MERVKVGTVIRKDLYEELKAEAERNQVSLSELIEQGLILLLRQQAVRRFLEVARTSRARAGAAERILRRSRRELEERRGGARRG